MSGSQTSPFLVEAKPRPIDFLKYPTAITPNNRYQDGGQQKEWTRPLDLETPRSMQNDHNLNRAGSCLHGSSDTVGQDRGFEGYTHRPNQLRRNTDDWKVPSHQESLNGRLLLPPPIIDQRYAAPLRRSPLMEPSIDPTLQLFPINSRRIAIPATPRSESRALRQKLGGHTPSSRSLQKPSHRVQIRLPPVSVLLSLARDGCKETMNPKGEEIETASAEGLQLPMNLGGVLPIPCPLQANSPAGYSLPAGAAPPRALASPISQSKERIQTVSPAHHCSSIVRPQITAANGNHHAFSQEHERYRTPRLGIRRQTMTDSEKRARKAAQQQRRRKHGPSREPRERFSEEEDRWLVTEKRRLEKEPNKHWTDLEISHRAKFPHLKDRTLSGLQSRYYRIKKKFPPEPQLSEGSETVSRWDEEVQGRFLEACDSEGEAEDEEMRDSSMDEDLISSGGRRGY